MKNLIKSVLTISITSALLAQTVQAASYEVIDLGVVDEVKHTYGIERNNDEVTLLSGQTSYDFPIQFDLLDEDDFDDIVDYADALHEQVYELNDIEDESNLRIGKPTANDLSWTMRWIASKGDAYQKIGDTFIYTNDGQQTKVLRIFDQIIPGTDEYSRSTIEIPGGVTDEGWFYGTSSAPYLPLDPFIDDDDEEVVHWITHSSDGDPLNGFSSRGWVSFDGETIVELAPLEDLYGGLSAVNDINLHRVAVGTSSVSTNANVIEDIEDDSNNGCYDDSWVGDDIPFEVCIFRYKTSLYFSNAMKWQIDTSNNVEAIDLGTGIVNVDEDDDRPFTSSATSINDNGLIVGYSHFWRDENETNPSENESVGTYAAVFKNDTVVDFTDHDEYIDSRAVQIANTGMFTGYMTLYINGSARTKFYYADANDDTIIPVFPDDFFPGSSSISYGINENGMIVGEGEYETFVDSNGVSRRRHGFLYDSRIDRFSDINTFLSCDSDYTIVEARDINENNEILATAFVKQIRLDSLGEPLIIDGETVMEDVLRAVYLKPIDGEIEDCSETEEKVERDGASFGFMSLFALFAFGSFRRRLSLR